MTDNNQQTSSRSRDCVVTISKGITIDSSNLCGLKDKESVIKCLVPNKKLEKKLFRRFYWNYKIIPCNINYLLFYFAVTRKGGLYYILQDWNGSGANIDPSRNSYHMAFLMKEHIPFDEARLKVMKLLDDNDKDTDARRSIREESIAHLEQFEPSPLISPVEQKICLTDPLFPDVLLINEISNDVHLTRSMFEAVGEYPVGSAIKQVRKVKLSYIYEAPLFNNKLSKNRTVNALSDQLILLITSENLNRKEIVQNLRNRKYDRVKDSTFHSIETFGNVKFPRSSTSNKITIIKKPDVQLYPLSFLDSKKAPPPYEKTVHGVEKETK